MNTKQLNKLKKSELTKLVLAYKFLSEGRLKLIKGYIRVNWFLIICFLFSTILNVWLIIKWKLN